MPFFKKKATVSYQTSDRIYPNKKTSINMYMALSHHHLHHHHHHHQLPICCCGIRSMIDY